MRGLEYTSIGIIPSKQQRLNKRYLGGNEQMYRNLKQSQNSSIQVIGGPKEKRKRLVKTNIWKK